LRGLHVKSSPRLHHRGKRAEALPGDSGPTNSALARRNLSAPARQEFHRMTEQRSKQK